MKLTLRQRTLDAVIDGKIGKGIVVTRAQFMKYFKDENPNTTSVFLSNHEMEAGEKFRAPNPFTIRIDEAKYQIHPDAIKERMKERATLKKATKKAA